MEAVLNPLTSPAPAQGSRRKIRAGIALSSLPVAFLIFDSVIKLVKIAPVVESFERLGYPASLARGIGLLESACLLLYLVPRTSVLGAVMLTGFLGGAITTHVRVGDPLFSHVLFPVYVAALLWAGLFLRDARVRALWTRSPAAAG
jgi:hypothetical protein